MKQSIQLYFTVNNNIIPKGNNVIEGIHNLFHIGTNEIHDNTAIYVHLSEPINKNVLELTLFSFCEHLKRSGFVIEAQWHTMAMPSQDGIIPFSFDSENSIVCGRYVLELTNILDK